MDITTLQTIWKVIQDNLPRDQWVPLTEIYDLVEANVELMPDDFLPSAPTAREPKWKRNVRNVLQHKKGSGEIAWDRDGRYQLQSAEWIVLTDGIRPFTTDQVSVYRIDLDHFRKIQESRVEIGELGEEWVVDHETNHLLGHGRRDLAERVRRVSLENVAAGFDVLSYDQDGNPKYIEVKTTSKNKDVFQITRNELKIAARYGPAYWIYFVTEIRNRPKLKPIQDPHSQIGTELILSPMVYEVRLDLKKIEGAYR